MILRKVGKLIAKKLPAGVLLGAMLLAVTITGCTSSAGSEDGRDPGVPTATQVVAEREGGDSRGEHGGSGQGSEPEAEDGELEAGGAGSEGSQGDDEHGSGEEGGRESGEAEMSSPIIPLGQSWTGVLGGLAVSMRYATQKPEPSEERSKTPSLRSSATCRPNLISSQEPGPWENSGLRNWDT